MKSFLATTVLYALLGASAWAQQVTSFPPASLPLSGAETMYLVQGGHGRQTQIGNLTPLPIVSAAAYGVVADGVTSNDQALGLALYACSKLGATLILPPGQIKLTGATLTGNATRHLQNCAMVGSGVPASVNTNVIGGTTLLLTSTSVAPLTCGSGWSVQGLNFLHPVQSGTTSYPPDITDDGAHSCQHGVIDHVTIVNAYDGIRGTPTIGWGNVLISNSTIYAVHSALSWGTIGDSILVSNTAFSPGPWLTYCNFTCVGAVDTAIQNNAILHAMAGATVNVNIDANSYGEGWHYGTLIDNGATVAESNINMNYDGVGTLIDSSSGGTYAIQNKFSTQSSGCFLADFSGGTNHGHAPCFNLSSASGLYITDSHLGAAFGDVFDLRGGYLRGRNIQVDSLGAAADGADYSLVNVISGSPVSIILQDSSFGGIPSSSKIHGIVTGANVPVNMQVQNNSWIYFNDEINAQTASQSTIIQGNVSISTFGSASITLSGSNSVSYGGNWWDKPPVVTTGTNCNGSGTATSAGYLNGHVFLGATGSVTACTITFPFQIAPGGGYTCIGQLNDGNIVTGGPLATTYTFNFADSHAATLFYMCGGQTD